MSTRQVVLSPQHGANSVIELGDKLRSVIREHIRRGAACVHPEIQERVGENGSRSSPERYRAN